jgi:short-subunit dehydrogenase
MKLENKRILLTGADGGIGAVIARQLHAQGCKLILVGIQAKTLDELNQTMDSKHEVVAVNLTNEEERKVLFDLAKKSGGIDGIINNAGISEFTFIEQQDAYALERLININLVAPMILCQTYIPILKKKEDAFILNMGSTFGSIGYPGFSAYTASKFGIRGYTETLRRELADSKINVMYLAPRATNTPINSSAVIEMNRELGNAMDDPAVVANAVISMLEKDQICRYLGWPEKLFVRVNSLFPKIVDMALRGKLSVIREFSTKKY